MPQQSKNYQEFQDVFKFFFDPNQSESESTGKGVVLVAIGIAAMFVGAFQMGRSHERQSQ